DSGVVIAKPEPAPEGGKPPEKKPDEKKKEPEKVKFERTDSQVAFNFAAGSPDPEKMGTEEFSVRWEGSVFAEETGTYEFIVKSENGIRLWVNDQKTLLIDAWVSSGPEVREEKKSIFLLGGRSYPLALDFFKF